MIEWLTGTTLGKCIVTFFVSMLPIGELRLGLPYGVLLGLPKALVLPVAIVGNMVPVPFIIVYIRKIFAWLRQHWAKLDGFITKLEQRGLPGTGAWTGSLVAALLNLKLRRAVPVIFVGVVIAALIMTALTIGFTQFF